MSSVLLEHVDGGNSGLPCFSSSVILTPILSNVALKKCSVSNTSTSLKICGYISFVFFEIITSISISHFQSVLQMYNLASCSGSSDQIKIRDCNLYSISWSLSKPQTCPTQSLTNRDFIFLPVRPAVIVMSGRGRLVIQRYVGCVYRLIS